MRRPHLSWLPIVGRRLFPWVVVDLPLVWVCYALALLVRGTTADLDYWPALVFGLLASLIVVVCNAAFGIYRRWWRYATSQDVVPLVVSVACATVLTVAADLSWPSARPMPLSVIFLGGFFGFCAMTAVRYRAKPLNAMRKTWRRLVTAPEADTTRVLVVGAGDAGQLLGWQLHYGPQADRYHVVGFVDDDRRKHGMLIHGRPVFGGRAEIPRLVESHLVDLIVIAVHRISGHDFRDIVGICQETTAQIKVLPNVLGTIHGDDAALSSADDPRAIAPVTPAAGASLFGDITLEDLLGRHSVTIDREQCRHLVRGKAVLVTGASGSIGAELCRQLADLRPARLLMLDNNESGLHDLTVELQGYRSDDTALVAIVADVTNTRRMRAIFARERPAIVFHAAAYKHVPLMEDYPEEAVRVNVGGTRLAMQLAAEYGAERFVLVSSDKAVEPSSVMGATKRVCELVGETMPRGRTLFTAVRFGNVLASRGSVVPTFTKQIDMGGPVTITDPLMARYFMSPAEASSLIIQAASYTEGSDVFILDMGEEINIADLARRMIRLRGLRPDVDIPIVVTGPRPGEKLREVLTSADERTVATPHPQVLRVDGGRLPCSPPELAGAVTSLLAAAEHGDRQRLLSQLWAIARDGVAPTPLVAPTPRPVPALVGAGGRSTSLPLTPPSVGDDDGWDPLLPPIEPSAERAVVARPRASPLNILLERVRERAGRLADHALAYEPYYVLPAAVALLAYPNPLVGVALAAIVLPWLLRWARTGRPSTSTPFDLPIGLFMVGAVVGLFATTSELWAGIRMAGLVAGLGLFALIVNHATTAQRVRGALLVVTLGTVVASVGLVVLAAPYTALAGLPGPWDPLIAITDGARQALLAPDEALERYRFRASGVGGLATFGLALAVGPALAGGRASTRRLGHALAIFFGGLVLLSGNRGSLISVVALGVALLGLRNNWFLATVPAVLIGLWALLERGLFGLTAPDALPLAAKITIWQNAALMLHDYALTGAGLGLRSVRDLYEAYFLNLGPPFSHAHNAFIQAYLEQGLLGCVGLVSLVATLFFFGRRTVVRANGPLAYGTALSAAGAAAVLLFEGLTEVVLLTSFGSVMLFLALGLLVAASRLDERIRPDEVIAVRQTPRWRSPRVATPVLGMLLVALIGAGVFTPLGASVYRNLGAVERARATLQDGTSREERERRLASAEALLRQGLALDEDDPSLWRNLAEVAIARDDAVTARQLLRRARERTLPDDRYALFQLGRLYQAAGFWQEAIRAWRDADAAEALQQWAFELRQRGQSDRAAAVYLAVAELRPRDPDPIRHFVQAVRQTRSGAEGAVPDLQRLTQIHPATPYPWLGLAELYDALGRPADAEAARAEAAARPSEQQ